MSEPRTVHVMTGLPASGKTTLALELVDASHGQMRRVNRDDLRRMLDNNTGGRLYRGHEETILTIQDSAILAILDSGHDLIIDNTHLTSRIPNRYRALLAGRDITWVVHDRTDVPLDKCLRRDAARPNSVGEKAIRELHQAHLSARRNGWRLTAEWLAEGQLHVEPYTPGWGLPTAYLVDIDGTIAHASGRGVFDFARCDTDRLDMAVAIAVDALYDRGHRILLMSGRDENHRAITEAWLAEQEVPFHELWMRAAGDFRRDDVVKAELFDKHVRHRYQVLAAIDDRDRIVALWRRMGIPCWQVAPGDF